MPIKLNWWLATLFLFLVSSPALAQNGGIELFSAETLFEDGVRLSVSDDYRDRRTLYKGSSRIHSSEHRRSSRHQVIAGADYGIHRDLTLSALIPFTDNQLHRHPGGRGQTAYGSGLGDVFLAAKYRPLRILWFRSAFNIAILGGVELPTGLVNKRERGTTIGGDNQPGSGSIDPVLAVLTTLSINRFRLDTQLRYKWNSKGSRDFDRGDVMISQIAFKYRFLHKKYPGPSASITAALRHRYESNARKDHRSQANFGSDITSIFISLGSHPIPALDVGLAVELPIYQRYRGIQLGIDTRIITRFGVRF
jgi:hypothetical protein